MSRDVLEAFDEAHIGIASATYDIVGFPALRYATASPANGPTKRACGSADE